MQNDSNSYFYKKIQQKINAMLTFKACKYNKKWGYNNNNTKLLCIDASTTSIKTFLNVQKMEKYELHAIVYAKKT